METLKFQCSLSCKNATPFYQTQYVAENQKDAESKGADLAKNFKTKDARLQQYIKDNGGVVSTVTQLN